MANVEEKWKWEPVSYQIADTGDYDGEHRFTNGKMTLISKINRIDSETYDSLVDSLNNWPDLYCLEQDAAEFELRLVKEENERLKEDLDALHERMQSGRDYLMRVQANEITVGSAFVAFGWNENGFMP